ncbi:hypothetical protein [Alienimonas californiensis]|uniref:Uncharacterized protein n=1 Tax=Alienimonas californiensis TaxID=2527989 RepID=A0A517P9M3_9PLAN|nr:hypothetical protein [Alienimonas californiensis]QDT16077.1 hypothetical protein CA12_21750 [Alienimonas californiensis]
MRPQHQFDWSHFWKWLPAYLAVVLALYVLAAGPLYYPIYYGVHSGANSFLVRLYLPLMVLCEAVPPIGAAMDWYLQFWV